MFHILHGEGWFGRTDEVSGQFRVGRLSGVMYVATKFFHLNGIPLIPLGAYVVIAYPGYVENLSLAFGMSQPLETRPILRSMKSLVLGYIRAGLMWASTLSLVFWLIFTVMWCNNDLPFQLEFDTCMSISSGLMAVSVILLLMLWLSYRRNNATMERAKYLTGLFGFSIE